MISQRHKWGMRNPWFLGILGLILLVFAVNGVFIWLSTHHPSTLVDVEYKTHDRKSNAAAVNELAARQALAWQTTIRMPTTLAVGEPASFEIHVADRAGQPVREGVLIVEAYRPSDASRDFSIPFREIASGTYQGTLTFPLKGYWELHLRLERGNNLFTVATNRFRVAAAP